MIRWLGARLADLIIHVAMWKPYHDLEGYMDRWWLFGGSDPDRDERKPVERGWRGSALDSWIGRKLRIAARVHHILRSDRDRHLHDHRWASLSIVLRGGYWEVTPLLGDGQEPEFDSLLRERRWYGPGSVIFRRSATVRHVLELPEGQTCWTLFFMFGKPQAWGFYTEHGKVDARDYDEYQAAKTNLERAHIAQRRQPLPPPKHWNCRSTIESTKEAA